MVIRLIEMLILVGDVWAIYNILESRMEASAKILWAIIVLALPLAGLILWHFFGPRK